MFRTLPVDSVDCAPAMSAIGPSRRLATALHTYAFGSKAVHGGKEQTLIGLSLCEFRLARLRLEKSLVNTERTGVPMIKNKWDFGGATTETALGSPAHIADIPYVAFNFAIGGKADMD